MTETIDEIMKNNLGRFKTATSTLRFFLKLRMAKIDAGEYLDWATAQGTWYLVEPYIPKKKNGEFVKRKNFVASIRKICDRDLDCRREDLKIVAGGRAEQYFDHEWRSVSWSTIEELSEKGVDIIIIEKEGMADILKEFVDKYGIAVMNTRGFFTDYVDDISHLSKEKKCNIFLITDFDPSGLVIRINAGILGIPCIGVNDEMLRYFRLERKDVEDYHPPSSNNPHWTFIKERTNPEIRNEIEYFSKYRIEIDKVHTVVGSARLFGYIKHKIKQIKRDYNRVIPPSEYIRPEAITLLNDLVYSHGKGVTEKEVEKISKELGPNYKGLINDIYKRKEENDKRVKNQIEADQQIKWLSKKLVPLIKQFARRTQLDISKEGPEYAT